MIAGSPHRVLITGATGLLGKYLLKTCDSLDVIYSKRFDILDKDATYSYFDEAKPGLVIHCAGEGRVDFAETNRCESWRSVFEGTELMLRAAHYWGSHFVYISSNAVYHGNSPPYNEYSQQDPVNVYGRYKSETETLVLSSKFKTTIVRPILLYGWPNKEKRGNFVTRTLDCLRRGEPVSVDKSIISQPTYAFDCASAIWKIIRNQHTLHDEINVSTEQITSMFMFAQNIATVFGCDINNISPLEHWRISVAAKRPVDTTFCVNKLRELGISLRNQMHGLEAMKKEMENDS